jgi:cytochrome c oxidase assembly protein subunit 15
MFGLLTGATFVLIVFGAMVRAHGAGLACPDWPLCFGQVVPRFNFHVAFEWGHRALAGSVSLGLAAISLWIARRPQLRSRVARPLTLAWLLLGVQVVLGGLTVLLTLAPWTVTAHLLVGNAFAATLLWCASVLSDAARGPSRAGERSGSALPARVRVLALATTAALLVQLALGGLVSSHYAGLACSSFPTCDGVSFVPSLRGLVGIHVLHRLGGYGLTLLFCSLVWVTRGSREPVARLARSGLRLVVLQIAIGVANVALQIPVEITALHSALAAALVLYCTLLCREVWLQRSETRVPERAPAEALGTS